MARPAPRSSQPLAAPHATPAARSPRLAGGVCRACCWRRFCLPTMWPIRASAPPATASALHNLGGRSGAWLSDLLLMLFGVSAWWWVVLALGYVIHTFRHLDETPLAQADGNAGSGWAVLACCCWPAPASNGCAPGTGRWRCRMRTAACWAPASAAAAGALLGFTGGSLILLLLMAVGFSLFTGVSWLSMAERTGEWVERAYWKAIADLAGLSRPQAGRSGAAKARSQGVGGQEEARRSAADPHRAGGEGSAAIRARHHRKTGAAVLRSARLAAAAAASARPGRRGGGNRERRGAGIHLADDRAQARRIRRRGEGGVGLARPGDHALRDRTGGRGEGQPDRQPGEGSGAHAVGDQHPRGRGHPRQAHHGAGDSQSQAADGSPVARFSAPRPTTTAPAR